MYDKLNEFLNSSSADENDLKQSDFLLALPKHFNATIGDIRELFDSVTKEDLKAIRKSVCAVPSYFEGDLEFELGSRAGTSYFVLVTDSTHHTLKFYKPKSNKDFF